jgi:hypothetical protein
MNNLFDKAKLFVTLFIKQPPMVSSAILSISSSTLRLFSFPSHRALPVPAAGRRDRALRRVCVAVWPCWSARPRPRHIGVCAPGVLVVAPTSIGGGGGPAAPAPRSTGQAATPVVALPLPVCPRASEHVRSLSPSPALLAGKG